MQPLPSPTFVGYVPTLKCALARLRSSAPSTGLDARQYASPVHRAKFFSRRTSSARRRPPGGESRRSALSTGLGWRRTSPAVCVCVVRDAAWRSIARLRRSAPSTGLDAGQYASPVHRAPFRSRRTSSSGDPTAARRPSEPDIRPATAARRVHFKRGGRSAETSASSVEPLTAKRVGRRAIEIAATTAKPPLRGPRPEIEMHPIQAGAFTRYKPLPVRPDRAFDLVARSVHGRAALVAHALCGHQRRRRPDAIRLRGARPCRAVRPDRAFDLVARSVHDRAALVGRTLCPCLTNR